MTSNSTNSISCVVQSNTVSYRYDCNIYDTVAADSKPSTSDEVWSRRRIEPDLELEELFNCYYADPTTNQDTDHPDHGPSTSRITDHRGSRRNEAGAGRTELGNEKCDSPVYDNVPECEIFTSKSRRRLKLTLCATPNIDIDEGTDRYHNNSDYCNGKSTTNGYDNGILDCANKYNNNETLNYESLNYSNRASDYCNGTYNGTSDCVVDENFARLIEMIRPNGFAHLCNLPHQSNNGRVAARLRNSENVDILSPTLDMSSLKLMPDALLASGELPTILCAKCKHSVGNTIRQNEFALAVSDTVNTDTTTDSIESGTSLEQPQVIVSSTTDAGEDTISERNDGGCPCEEDRIAPPPVMLIFRRYRLATQPETTV